MKEIRFSLIHLVIGIAVILAVAYVVTIIFQPQSNQPTQVEPPVPSIPFQNLKMK